MIFAQRGVVVPSVALAAAFSACGAQAAPAGLASSVAAAALAKGAGAASTLAIAKGILKLMAWAKARTAIVVGAGVLLAGAGTATVAIKAARAPADDLIGGLEHQSGKTIAWDKHLSLPATFDFKNLSLEQALDMLSVEAGAYWSIDYAVYGSNRGLRQLLEVLHEGTALQDGGWTNLSSRPLEAHIAMVAGNPHGLSGGGVFGVPTNQLGNSVNMTVVLGREAADRFRQTRQPGRPPMEMETIRQSMRDGVGEGALAPERLLAETRLLAGANLVTPMPPTAEAAAHAAKTLHARWTTIYTLRKAPLDGAGIKLIHSGSQTLAAQAPLPDDPAELQEALHKRIMERALTNGFNLTPEDREAHRRAVDALKHKP
jgi:hypothetical protein